MSEDAYYNTKRAKKDFKRFEKFFEKKPFYNKYRNLHLLCYGLSWLFDFLSVASGVLGGATLLTAFIIPNLLIAAIISLVVLAILQLIKRWLLTGWVKEKLNNDRVSPGFLTTNLLLIAVSGVATVYGGIEVVNLARGKSKPSLVSTKAIEKKYNTEITEIKAKQKDLIARNTVGKNTYLSPDEEADFQNWEEDIRKFRAQKEKEIAAAKKGNGQKLKEYASGTDEYITGFIIASVIIESLCIITLWYYIFYQYKSLESKEATIASYQQQPIDTLTLLNQLKHYGITIPLLQNFNPSPPPIKATPEKLNEPAQIDIAALVEKEVLAQIQKVNPENEKEVPETLKTQPTELKVEPENGKVQGENEKEPPQNLNETPILKFQGYEIPKEVQRILKPSNVEPIRQGKTEKESQEGQKVPSSPYKNGRGPSLDWEAIEPDILAGKLSNKEIAEKYKCGESTIRIRRSKLAKELNGKTINNS
ncbi:hypothetical protein BKI52_32845 [marine bacterium AO1-C]|nr:hypothetical protein BKI52_32845 [marine bacterium AO1-C]